MRSTTVKLELGERSYAIEIGAGQLELTGCLTPFIAGPDALLVSNETVAPLYAERVEQAIGARAVTRHIMPDGEQQKTLRQVETIYDSLVAMRANRDTTIVAVGGGVVGDMAGFAAATYQRGVRFVQVPTTLLAQVDSSVGGKTGVNLVAGKNLVGAFHQPAHVLIDIDTLATLADREFIAGLAEVIKYGLVYDGEFFTWLETNIELLNQRDPDALVLAISRSCEIKAAVVAADEREGGQRALLNLGHTFGHAIEKVAGYGVWLHGEAVAAGMVMAALASGLSEPVIERIEALLLAAGLPVAPPPLGTGPLREAMQLDKKVRAGRVRLVLLNAIGAGYVSDDYDEAALEVALRRAGD